MALEPRERLMVKPAATKPNIKERLLKRMDSIRNTFTGMGDDKVFAGRPDLYRQPLTWQELTQLWRYNGLARRYVEVVPNDATRKGGSVVGPDGAIEGLDHEEQRLDVWGAFNEADTWGRLYGSAWILMVTTETKPPPEETGGRGDLAAPLVPARVISLDNLVVLDVSEATPIEYDTRLRSPTFREPLRYSVNLTTGGYATGLETGGIVHASRMLYFCGTRLPPSQRLAYGGIDDSILQSVWDQIRNAGQLEHALAVLANEIRISKLKMRDLSDLEVNDEAAYFDYRMREMAKHKSVLNTVLLGDGEEYTHEGGTVSGMAELTNVTRQALQAVTGMPEQLWIGNAPGGLSTDGESHRNLWAQLIASYQAVKYEPQLRALYEVIFAARTGPTAGQVPEVWHVEFEPLDELTAKGKADLKKTTADTDAVYLDRGVVTAEQVAAGRFGPDGWQEQLPSEETVEAPGLNMAAIEAALADPTQAAAAGAPAAAPVDVAKQAMNGAQASALQAMIESAKAGTLPVGALGPMIRASFQALVPPAEIAAIEDAVRAELGQPAPVVDPVTGVTKPAPVAVDTGDDEGEPQPSSAEALAAELTEEEVERCQHGSMNRCRICGIERRRALQRSPTGEAMYDPEGAPMWALEWVAIGQPRTEAAKPAAPAHAPLLAPLGAGRKDQAEAGVWIGIPLPDAALPAYQSAQLEAAIRTGTAPGDLNDRGKAPHVTVLWLGKLTATEAAVMGASAIHVLDDLLGGAADDAAIPDPSRRIASHDPIALQGCGIGAFAPSPSSDGETVLYMGVSSDALCALQRELSSALLTEEQQRERPWYVAHATLGYRPGELTVEQWNALWDYRGGRESWTANVVELHVGDVVTRWVLGEA